jgi:hypothetical protein
VVSLKNHYFLYLRNYCKTLLPALMVISMAIRAGGQVRQNTEPSQVPYVTYDLLPQDPGGAGAKESVPQKIAAQFETSVTAAGEQLNTEGVQRSFTAEDVEHSAGTFGDVPRFLQTLSGVVSDNDQRNDFLVRGGNPSETSFVIDNIEVPSINQLALSDTTGGFFSMLDNNAIQHFALLDDAYSSRYDQRLSAVVDISTRNYGHVESHRQYEAGIAGVGGSQTGSFGNAGTYFVSARTGILQYLTDDIGLNGTPHYRNAFARAESKIGPRDSWWGMSLFGIDSMGIHPDPNDPEETNPYDVGYSGWRSTTGVNWQHIFSDHMFGVASVAYSKQTQKVTETDQLQSSALVYSEHSGDSTGTAKYDLTYTPKKSLLLEIGVREAIDDMGYDVNQPLGLQNPYSPNPQPYNQGAFTANRVSSSSAFYADATWNLPYDIQISAGERIMHWAVDGKSAFTTRASIAIPIRRHSAFFSYSEHAQLPASLYLLAFNNLQTLKPIVSRQWSFGMSIVTRPKYHLTLAAYNKSYRDYPVAAGFPQLSLANIADTFGQAFLMFPMSPQGTGVARGLEATSTFELGHRLSVSANAAYARSWFAAADGVLRRGNYDIPFTSNLMAYQRLGKGLVFSGRFNLSSGRAYTPDDLGLSVAQNRDVYDLTRINVARSASYQRLDFRFEQEVRVWNKPLTWYVGLENALDRQNFYAEMWEPYLRKASIQPQMGRFPDAGVKIVF